MARTPTPWAVEGCWARVPGRLVASTFPETTNYKDDIAFIVQAVNCHDALVEQVKADLTLVKEMEAWADGLRRGTVAPADLANHILAHARRVEKNRALALAKVS